MGVNLSRWQQLKFWCYCFFLETRSERKLREQDELLESAEGLWYESKLVIEYYHDRLTPDGRTELDIATNSLRKMIRRKSFRDIPVRMRNLQFYLDRAWSQVLRK